MKVNMGFAARCALLVAAFAAVVACGDDGTPANTAGTGAGGSLAGAPAGGSTAGMPAGGGGGSGGNMFSCTSANTTLPPAMLHAAAAAAMLPSAMGKGCAFTSCHDSSSRKAGLVFTESPIDLRMQIVGKAACEVPTYQLVDTSGGDAALAKSWLWQKLVAPVNSSGELMPNAAWGTAASGCGQDTGMGFGVRMPRSGSDMLLTPPSKLEAVRDWICAGAPGPM